MCSSIEWMNELRIVCIAKLKTLYQDERRPGQLLITFANTVKACCCVTNAFVQDCELCEKNTSHNLQESEGKFVYVILPTCTVTDF